MINNHRLIIIVAVDENWAIGKDNDLLYKIPADMKFFREKTRNNIVVYGYNTLLSFPNNKPLSNRTNIVLTSKNISSKNNLLVAHSIDEVNSFIEKIEDDRDVFICGGASVYKQYIDICDYAYITKIQSQTSNATAFMVNLDKKENWILQEASNLIVDNSSQLTFTFNLYQRLY
jgi:dihydrofolate reductase